MKKNNVLEISTSLIISNLDTLEEFQGNPQGFLLDLEEISSVKHQPLRKSIFKTRLYERLYEKGIFTGVGGNVSIKLDNTLVFDNIDEVELFWVNFFDLFKEIRNGKREVEGHCYSIYLKIKTIENNSGEMIQLTISDNHTTKMAILNKKETLDYVSEEGKKLFYLLTEIVPHSNYSYYLD